MPFYEYRCTQCGHEEEVLQKVSDKPLRKCPACGKLTMKKQISAAAFRLKGGGWYETDFKSGGRKNVAGDDHADNRSGNKQEKKTDNKAEPGKTGKKTSAETGNKKKLEN